MAEPGERLAFQPLGAGGGIGDLRIGERLADPGIERIIGASVTERRFEDDEQRLAAGRCETVPGRFLLAFRHQYAECIFTDYALAGRGVHLVTVNNYLAKRDSEWNAPLFQFHGLSVDCIDKHEPNTENRRQAYLADVTYGTNNEFGFDYLRDNMAREVSDLVQRKHNFAIVDEVDSVLIDDARTPLIISGPTPTGDKHEFMEFKPRVEKLLAAQKAAVQVFLTDAKRLFAEGNEKEAGIPLLRAYRGLPKNGSIIKFLSEPGVRALLQKTENYYMQDQQKEMHKIDVELYFVIDEKQNSVDMTEKGIDLITGTTDDPHFFVIPNVGGEIADLEKKTFADPKEKLALKEVESALYKGSSRKLNVNISD